MTQEILLKMSDATENACEGRGTSFDELPPCVVSALYTFLPDAASRHALASTSKGVRAAVLHHISKLTVPKEQLCISGSNYNPLFSFPKNASLRTLVLEGHAGLEEHDDGPQLNELLLPQPEDTYRRVLFMIMNLRELELKEVSISLEDHAIQLGVLVKSLPDLQVLRLSRIRSPPVVLLSCLLAFKLHGKGNSIRELHLEGAEGCDVSPALHAISAMTSLKSLSLSHDIDLIEPQPSLTVLSSLQQLQHLTVLGSWGGYRFMQDLSERPLMRLLAQLPHLQSFESYYGPFPEVIAALPQSLTSLHCMGCMGSPSNFDYYTEYLDGLKRVREAVCAQRLPNLRKLVLRHVSFLPNESEAWISSLWFDIARLIGEAMLIPAVSIAVKDVSLVDLDAFAVFCSIVPSVAEHIESIEMTSDPCGSSLVSLAEACPNLTSLTIQEDHPGGDLAWLYQLLTLFKGLRTVEFSGEPYGFPSASPGALVASELPSVLRASADATKRTQPLEFKCKFTIDSIAYDDKAYEQSMRQEVQALEESVKASCAKSIDFKASVSIAFPEDDFLDDYYDDEGVDFA